MPTAPKLEGPDLHKAKMFTASLAQGMKRPQAYLKAFPAAKRLNHTDLTKRSTAYAKRKRVKELVDKNKVNAAFNPKSKKSADLMDYICEQVASGRSLISILEDDKSMPTYRTVWLWRKEDPEFSERYQSARECQGDYHAEMIVKIADHTDDDFVKDEDGVMVLVPGSVQRDKLKVEARRWFVSRLNPPVWGDKQSVQVDINVDHEKTLNEAFKRAGIGSEQKT